MKKEICDCKKITEGIHFQAAAEDKAEIAVPRKPDTLLHGL